MFLFFFFLKQQQQQQQQKSFIPLIMIFAAVTITLSFITVILPVPRT